MSDELVLGAASQLLRPDAIDDFGAAGSEEAGMRAYVRGAAVKPAGAEGETTMRRLYITGYHQAAVSLFVTPIVDGLRRIELRTFCFKPATTSGRIERFSFIVALAGTHPDYPEVALGLRGTLFEAELELRDPAARIFLEGLTYAHEPIAGLRARGPEE